METIEVALAGNPNTGKTCIFNNLTGAKQRVGNWPGVTVEKKEGEVSFRDKLLKIVDLPGTYSLGAYSEDEIVARHYLLNDKPAIVVNVVDACNIQRNLYLTMQIMEAGARVVVALNMMDEACRKCISIDVDKLATLLGVPVIPTIAAKKSGMGDLLAVVADQQAKAGKKKSFAIDYGPVLEKAIAALEEKIKAHPGLPNRYPRRWLAIKLLEDDEVVKGDIAQLPNGVWLLELADAYRESLAVDLGGNVDAVFIARRYGYINAIVAESMRGEKKASVAISDRIDRVVTNKWLGIPVFLFSMWLLFEFTFRLSGPFVDLIEEGFGSLAVWLQGVLAGINASPLFTSFIADGLISGLGTVLAILPVLFTLFFGIALLEDSGYMARIAYVMDKPMRRVGLNGKSFISFLLGFGCNVPAIMSTRTLDSKRDRLLTIIANPFISCAARLPVYILFAGAFFPRHKTLVVASLYFIGLLMSILTVKLFGKVVPRQEEETFIIELPPYRLPTLRGVFVGLWQQLADFLRKVTTIILASVIVIWALSSLPLGVEYASGDSLVGKISSFIAPVFTWAGFANWQATIALIFGVLAKEVVVSTLGVVYKTGGRGLDVALAAHFTPLSAYAFMVMTLLYAPCIATIATIKSETKSLKWTLATLAYGLTVAWVFAVLVYQVGTLLGLG